MQLKHILFITLLFLGVVVCDDQVNEAGTLLTSLVIESEQKLQEFDDQWNVHHAAIKGFLDQIYSEFLTLEAECQDKDAQISNTDQEKDNSEHYIEWIGAKIQENQVRITKLEDAHCSTSKVYINGLKHNKIALNLIAFLRLAIEQKDSMSLAQKRSITKQLTVFFELYAKNQMKALQMLQQDEYTVETDTSEQARTQEEIGQGHVDDNREQIDVEQFDSSQRRDWPTYKAELLALLDTLEQTITEKMNNAQDEQINSGVSLAEYKIQIESENQDLDRHLANEAERIGRLEARKAREQAAADQCMDQLNIVTETLIQVRADYNDEVENHDSQRADLQEEVELFRQVWSMYQNVESGDYEDREVDSFSILN